MSVKNILFVCNGNVFRSVSAEYSLKKYISDNGIKGFKVSSAGVTAGKQPIDPKVRGVLRELGVKNIRHKQRKLSKKILNESDLVIAMAQDQVDFIKNTLKSDNVLLFNELAINKKKSVWDIEDNVKDWATNRKGVEKFIEKTVRYIYGKTPSLTKNILKRGASF